MTQHIWRTCGIPFKKDTPTKLYEDNVVCLAQLKGGYKKGIEQNIFYQNYFSCMIFKKNSNIEVQQIHSSDNLDLFTKAPMFEKLVHNIGMR